MTHFVWIQHDCLADAVFAKDSIKKLCCTDITLVHKSPHTHTKRILFELLWMESHIFMKRLKKKKKMIWECISAQKRSEYSNEALLMSTHKFLYGKKKNICLCGHGCILIMVSHWWGCISI